MAAISSPTPLYHRIYVVLRERLVSGYYPAGSLLPSEAELQESFEVSRITIRKAMELLVHEGLIERKRGSGTYAVERRTTSDFAKSYVSDVHDLLSYLSAVGLGTSLRVISSEMKEAPARICKLMDCAPQDELHCTMRVRNLDGQPYSLSLAYLLPEIGKNIDREGLATTAMIDLVQRNGAVVNSVEQVLTATLADETIARHLQTPVGAPVMRVTRVFCGPDKRPFYIAEIFYRSDRYEYRVLLQRNHDKTFQIS
ncbi:GntR family transcriptional regulator [Chelativorans sp. Marseille-P2723]|uniref:GntR family transcriptional regulator n=1 Tax=Chelativorans sp. Marseille-P2723 TaxID=2709133 RepID=UPI0015705736|nr:GntR family transcriptional regulator [Chelativorans sp. Marseille-P2723]